MARIGENAFRQYRDGQDRLTAPEYMAERELIRLAVNDLDDKVQRTEGIREEFSNTVNEVEAVKGDVVQTKQEIEARIGEFTQTIDQTTQELQQAKEEVQEVSTLLADTAVDIEDRGVNLKTLGLKGDGVTNDTISLSNALNSNITHFFAPSGAYLITDTVTVNSNGVKVITGTEGTVFKVNLTSSKILFNLMTNVIFSNVVLDFSNSYCRSAISYKANFGKIKLSNVEIRNIKDIDSVTSSVLINIPAEGNEIDLEKISFKNILKRGNGNITDGAGSMNGIYYNGDITTPSALGGNIRSVYAENFHNINSSDSIVLEDTTVVYLALKGKTSNVKIYDVDGYEFGKRLLKIQASNTIVSRVKGESHTGDSLSVIGVMSEPGQFECVGADISNVKCVGNMDAAIATTVKDTVINDCDVDLYGSNALNSGANHWGVSIGDGADNTVISRTKITAKRHIGLINTTKILKNIRINNVDFIMTPKSGGAITQIHNSAYGFEGLYINNVSIVCDPAPVGPQTILYLEESTNRRNKDIQIDGVRIEANDSSSSTYAKSGIAAIKVTDNVKVKNVVFNNKSSNALNNDALTIDSSVNVEIESVEILNRTVRGINISGVEGLLIRENKLNAPSNEGHIILNGCTKVDINEKNEKAKIVYKENQDATEVIRTKGTTAQRPKRAYQAFRFFDTTLGKDVTVKTPPVIASNGTITTPPVWVDAMGNTV